MYISNNKLINHPDRIIDFLTENDPCPVTAEIHLTNKCNNNCYYCGATRGNNIEMDAEKIRKSLLFLWSIGTEAVVFTGGGEPTVNKLLPESISAAGEIGLDTGLITNGCILNYRHFIDNLTWIRISIDAGDKETYKKIRGVDMFNKVVENIYKIAEVKKKTTLGLQIVANEYNQKDLEKHVETLLKLPVDYVSIRPIESIEGMEVYKNKTSLIMQLKEIQNQHKNVIISNKFFIDKNDFKACHAAELILTIDPVGDVYICCHHVGNAKYKIGNIDMKADEFFLNRRMVISSLPRKGFNNKACPVGCRGHAINITCDRLIEQPHRNFL
jgi:cyclic pyranopterin phosphate synthase